MTDAASIICLSIVLILQELQIVRLQTKINMLDRKRKSMLKSMCIQNLINDAFADLILQKKK